MYKTINYDFLIENLSMFYMIYDLIRIVNPISKTSHIVKDNNIEEIEDTCYLFWQQNKICQNCISMRAYNEDDTFFKVEFNGKILYMVMAIPVKTNKGKLVVELLKNITDKFIIDGIDLKDVSQTFNKINKLNELIVKDELTGIYNRRFINERLVVEIFKAVSSKQPLSIVLADIDHFKNVNDTYGHLFGDEVLKSFAKTIQDNIRNEMDWVARYGGEEFLICLINTNTEDAFTIAERIRKDIENKVIELEEYNIKITASFGIATIKDNLLSANEFIAIADKNLYKAKNCGRNNVVC